MTTTPHIPHTLTIRPPTDEHVINYTITCPAQDDPARACITYEDCGCPAGPDGCDQDGQPCPRNPGHHHTYFYEDCILGVPTITGCWPRDNDEAHDAVADMGGSDLVPGTYLIGWANLGGGQIEYTLTTTGGAA